MKNDNLKINGILVLDKPEGAIARHIDNRLKKLLKPQKIGHLGTLDPFACGVMPILIGSATRLADYLDEQPKVYHCTICVGVSTNTWDVTGEVIDVKDASHISDILLEEAILSFEGEIEQKIPPFSAAKRGGKRSYNEARKGVPFDPGVKKVKINQIWDINIVKNRRVVEEGEEITFAFATFNVKCGRGAYIRSLAVEIGERLQMPASLLYLRRTESSGFTESAAVSIEGLNDEELMEKIKQNIISPRLALPHIPEIKVAAPVAERVINGGQLTINTQAGRYKIVCGERLLALAEKLEKQAKLKYLCVLPE